MPRTIYRERADFSWLAERYDFFRAHVFDTKKGCSIDFSNEEAVRALTKALLKDDFGLDWEIPEAFLCPPVPQRANYIHWVADVVAACAGQDDVRQCGPIKGVDVGVGANCIFPLLGQAIYGWSFVGTDINKAALEVAQANVDRNALGRYISLRWVEDPLSCLVGVLQEEERFDFCMSNPPFFEREDQTHLNPKTVCTGNPLELVCEGGEQRFLQQMVDDSFVLRERVRVYTTMIGRKVTLQSLLKLLHQRRVPFVTKTEFQQGRITRWGLAWSFMDVSTVAFPKLLAWSKQQPVSAPPVGHKRPRSPDQSEQQQEADTEEGQTNKTPRLDPS